MTPKEYLAMIFDGLKKSNITTNVTKKIEWDDGFTTICGMFIQTRKEKRKLFLVGNGGSAAIAEHFLTDFLKNGGMRTVNIMSPALITCLSNDFCYANVYTKSLQILADEDDLLVAISSSGNSSNIVHAIETAKAMKMKVITFSGFMANNHIRAMGDYNIYVPVEHYGIVESIHNLLLQQIVDTIKL